MHPLSVVDLPAASEYRYDIGIGIVDRPSPDRLLHEKELVKSSTFAVLIEDHGLHAVLHYAVACEEHHY